MSIRKGVLGVVGLTMVAIITVFSPTVRVQAKKEESGQTVTKAPIISKEEAVAAALEAAGAKREEVTELEVKREDESKRAGSKRHPYAYEVEFKYKGFEYEFEIDGITKEVLQSEVDRL